MSQLLRYVLVLIVVGISSGEEHYLDPTVDLVSCLPKTINMEVSDLQDGGIMYIKSHQIAYNMQDTMNGSVLYTCLFDECRVEWNQEFLFVIQRKPNVQTAHDVMLLFTCIADQSDLLPDDGSNHDIIKSEIEMFMVQAYATLRFYNNSQELSSGSYVKLGTPVQAVVQLTDNYDGMLDINVKSCEASGIQLLLNRCPTDEDLFDTYNKTDIGVLKNDFLMFRATTMGIEPVSMMFSCLLEVCYAPCTTYVCNGTEPIESSSRRKRATSGDVAKSLSVSTLFRVGTQVLTEIPPYKQSLHTSLNQKYPVYVYKEREACITQPMYLIVFLTLTFAFTVSVATATYSFKECRSINKSVNTQQRVKNINATQENKEIAVVIDQTTGKGQGHSDKGQMKKSQGQMKINSQSESSSSEQAISANTATSENELSVNKGAACYKTENKIYLQELDSKISNRKAVELVVSALFIPEAEIVYKNTGEHYLNRSQSVTSDNTKYHEQHNYSLSKSRHLEKSTSVDLCMKPHFLNTNTQKVALSRVTLHTKQKHNSDEGKTLVSILKKPKADVCT